MADKIRDNDKPTSSSLSILSKIRVNRTLAIEIAALGLILMVGIILRVLPLRWGQYLNEYDPFFWYRSAEYIASNGYQAWFSWRDTLSWYPIGRDIAHSSYPGNPFTAVFLWQLLNTIGVKVTVYTVALYFPILFASLTCIAAYFLGKDVGGKAVGIFTALFMAVSPSYISRTVFGFFDTENIGIFGMVATTLFFLRSQEEKKPLEIRILYSIAAGLAMGYAFASWGAARYIVGLLSLYVIINLLMGKSNIRLIISFAITSGVGFIIALIIPRLGFSYLLNIDNLAVPAIIVLLVVYETIKNKLNISQLRLAVIGLVVVGFIAFLILPSFGIGNAIASKFLRVLNPFQVANPLFASVGEHRLSSWSSFFGDYGITIFLAVLGTYFAIKDGSEKKIFSILFFLTSIYFAGTLVRLLLVLAFPASLMAAYGLVNLILPFISMSSSSEAERRKRKRTEALGMNKGIGVLFIILLLFSFVPHVLNSTQAASAPGPLASSSVPVLFNGEYPQDWIKALNWMKANTTQDSIICSWWDYGYWIEGVANRTTLADGATMNQQQIINIANMMMKPHNESLPIMKSYGVDYVVVFVTYNPNKPTEEWPFGDNAKWPRMAEIAGYNLTKFYEQDPVTGQSKYTAAYTNSTIARLMYKSANSTHFKSVYISDNGFVRIYKVEY